jgi:hypothetical protein
MDTSTGKIIKVVEGQGFYVCVPFTATYKLEQREIKEVFVTIQDARHHSPIQHGKVFALVNEITRHFNGYISSQTMKCETEYMRAELMNRFCIETGTEVFSMSDIDMTVCGEFIDYLVRFCLENDVPCWDNTLLGYCEDISKLMYSCLMNRKCCLCGKYGEVHHVDTVGMGNDRTKIHHLGLRALALCRVHHNEAETIGNLVFFERYCIYPIKLDERLCKKLNLKI